MAVAPDCYLPVEKRSAHACSALDGIGLQRVLGLSTAVIATVQTCINRTGAGWRTNR